MTSMFCPPSSNHHLSSALLPEWFQSPEGNSLLNQQQAALTQQIPSQFYQVGLQLGLTHIDFMSEHQVDQTIYCDRVDTNTSNQNVVALAEAIPLPESCVDLAIMLHTLDYCHNPHHVLREISQILRPEGILVISGFHPYSLWGLRQKLGKRTEPFSARFLARSLVQDWLELLGFQPMTGCMINYQLPNTKHSFPALSNWMEHAGDRWWPTLGGVYFLIVKKQVYSQMRPHESALSIKPWLPKINPAQAHLKTRNGIQSRS